MNSFPSKIILSNNVPVSNNRTVFKIYSMKRTDKHIINYYETQKKMLSKELGSKIPETIELCTDKSKLKECLIMWDEIEELSATLHDIKTKIKLIKND